MVMVEELKGWNKQSQIISWTHGDLQCDLNDVIKPRSNKSKLLSNNYCKGNELIENFLMLFFISMALIASILFLKNLMR